MALAGGCTQILEWPNPLVRIWWAFEISQWGLMEEKLTFQCVSETTQANF